VEENAISNEANELAHCSQLAGVLAVSLDDYSVCINHFLSSFSIVSLKSGVDSSLTCFSGVTVA